jgi:hypothetical protein
MCKCNDQLMMYVNERNRWVNRPTEEIPGYIQVEHVREGTSLPGTLTVVCSGPLRVGTSQWLIFHWIMADTTMPV